MQKMSHLDESGRTTMMDVSGKPPAVRYARASGRIEIAAKTAVLIQENAIKKGDAFRIAEFAGIQAAKLTPLLVPLCHPVKLTSVKVRASLEDGFVNVIAEAHAVDSTGVEMEALTAASVALLTIYDMCKAVDGNMRIGEIGLEEKTKHEIGRI